jgi:hypothetical protein
MASSVDSTSQTPKLEQIKQQKAQRDFLALLNLGAIAISSISLLFLLMLFVMYFKLANRPVPSLVQLADGQAITTRALGNKERSPVVIQRFVTDSLMLLMSWQQKIPSADIAPDGSPVFVNDPGMEVKGQNKEGRITTRAFQASFAFSEEFRQDLIEMLAIMTPPDVFTGQVQTALVFQAVTEPELVETGEWRISVVGNLIQSNLKLGTTTRIPFNKEVLVRAIDTPPLPAEGKFASPFESVVYVVRQAGIEIYSMKDIGGQP